MVATFWIPILIYANYGEDFGQYHVGGEIVCPKCGKPIGVIYEQVEGEVSIGCPHGCGFHAYCRERQPWVEKRRMIGRIEEV